MNKTEQQFNLLAQNLGVKLAQVEAEKAILQIEVLELTQKLEQLAKKDEMLHDEDSQVVDVT